MKDFKRGISLSLLLSVAVLVLFFKPLLKDPNHVYFSSSGDGLKSYIGAIYHLEVDSTLFRMNAMNYPYGEMAFFTDCQPMIVNPVKMLSNHGIDFRTYIAGILNMLMLLSVVLGALFICLIFLELNVSWWFAAFASVGIAMLSPQIGRLGGHFSLSHQMWLPMLIWLLIKFDRNKSYLISVVIGLVTFLAAGMHMYFFALFGFLFLFYWLFLLCSKQVNIRKYHWLLHLFIQLILPLILVQLIVGSNGGITDRTTHPWGFTTYRANPATVFLPLHKPYATFLMKIEAFHKYDWEAFAFIGFVAFIGVITGIVKLVQRIIREQPWWRVSGNMLINIFFWASVASLLLSFGVPFTLGMMWLLDYLGPIQQLRALARFSWLFYYMINILVFYAVFKLFQKGNLLKIPAILALVFLLYDGYLNVKAYAPRLNNRIPELEDSGNSSHGNAWVHQIDKSQFQSIFPLPYFHIGSENVWLEPKCDIAKQSYIVSLKTGLPSMAVMLSRTSISQTYKSLELISQPVGPFRILDELPNKKPLLLVVDNCSELNANEQRLVSLSEKIGEGPEFSLYRLDIDPLQRLAQEGEQQFEREMQFIHAGQQDSVNCIAYDSFEQIIYREAFYGKGAVRGSARCWCKLFDDNLKGVKPGDKCELFFWVHNFEKDLMARTAFELVQKNGDEVSNYQSDQFQHFFWSFKDGWMRIRIPFEVHSEDEKISLSVRNKELKSYPLVIDELMIKKLKQ